MGINALTPVGLWGSRVKQVAKGSTPFLTGLNKYSKAATEHLAQHDKLGLLTCDSRMPQPLQTALTHQGIGQVVINFKKDDSYYSNAHLQTGIKAALRAIALHGGQENTIFFKGGNMAITISPAQEANQVNATISSLDELTIPKSGGDEALFAAKRILKRLPMNNYLSLNFWRGKMANIVMASKEMVEKFSELTNKMLKLEKAELTYKVKVLAFKDLLDKQFPRSERKNLPRLLRFGLFVSDLSPALFYFTFKICIQQAAKLFIAGEDIKQAEKVINDLRMSHPNLGYILDFVSEYASTQEIAQTNLQKYAEAIKSGKQMISVKLTGLVPNFTPDKKEEAIAVLNSLLVLAKEHTSLVVVDMEDYPFVDTTLDIFMETIRRSQYEYKGHLGLVNQTYLRRSLEITEKLKDFANECSKYGSNQKLFIRFVKGAYPDKNKDHVLNSQEEVDVRYIDCLKIAYEAYGNFRIAIASHNIRTISEAIGLAKTMKRDDTLLEFEMLLGMPTSPLLYALAEFGRACRFYLPVGTFEESLGYFMRRMKENASATSCQRLFIEFKSGIMDATAYLTKALFGI